MGLLERLPVIIDKAKQEYQGLLEEEAPAFSLQQTVGSGENRLALGDNLEWMAYLLHREEWKGKLQLVYIDPPFFSKADYGAEIKLNAKAGIKVPVMKQKAYRDTWENGMEEYLSMLAVRFYCIRDLLAEEGCLWVHLDHHAVHYVKVLLDEIFGEKNFINEVIWTYKSGGVSKHAFAKKHDNLLFYARSPRYYFAPRQEKSYNRGYKPYRFKGVKEYRDETGWFTMVNRKDVWQIDMVGRTSAERTGYATQKPEQLMERILESCTREGDWVADFFCGSGTMPAAANRLGRRWMACDQGRLAVINTHKRMVAQQASYTLQEVQREAEGRKEQGTVGVRIQWEEQPVTGGYTLRVELTGYQPASLKDVPVEEKYLPTIRKVIKEDPLALVDCWSVQLGSEGENSPAVSFCRNGKQLTLQYESLVKEQKPVTVRVIDIFGNGGTTTK